MWKTVKHPLAEKHRRIVFHSCLLIEHHFIKQKLCRPKLQNVPQKQRASGTHYWSACFLCVAFADLRV